MSNLSAKRVHEILLDSLFRDSEVTNGQVPEGAVISSGVMRTVGMHKERLESHREEVREMLKELPDNFQEEKGGGWSFLNACLDKSGRQWAEHENIDELLVLAQGLGMAKILLPREAWSGLPGGMPYFSVSTS